MAKTSQASSGSGTTVGYRVEARTTAPNGPQDINGVILDGEWRTVPIGKAPPGFGVPVGWQGPHSEEQGLVPYETAMALAYWFCAGGGAYCVEVRLARYEIVYEFSVERKGSGPTLHPFEDQRETEWVERDADTGEKVVRANP